MYNHYHNQDIEFHITQFPPVPLCGQSLPLTLSLGDHRSVFCPHRIYFPEWHINGIILHTVFWDRLLLLTILHLQITHAGVSMSVRFSMHLIYDYERFTLILVIRFMQSLTSDQVFSCQVESQKGLWDFVWLPRTLVYWRPPSLLSIWNNSTTWKAQLPRKSSLIFLAHASVGDNSHSWMGKWNETPLRE